MATILLAAAGAAVGSAAGGAVLGLSGAVIGRAVGATVGRVIDQRLLGLGSDPVEVGRLDRFRIMGASEGTPIPICWGAVRLPAHVIWASPYTEIRTKSGGGKGTPKPQTVRYSYIVSLALALCEGEILGIGRIWADGQEISATGLDLRVYPGNGTQLPDPVIEVHEGIGQAPAYRDTAYVVIENLALEAFGNRVPQFSFEVFRQANGAAAGEVQDFQTAIPAVALIPGTGEYALSTRRARVADGFATSRVVNVSGPSGETDFDVSLAQMRRELPGCTAVSLVICWFGSDLRCAEFQVRPKVESRLDDAVGMPWRSGGIARGLAEELPQIEGRPVYGGTPSDLSVIEAIRALSAEGKSVMFYPFVLMDQIPGNSLPNPYDAGVTQPAFPWRGRITLSVAPGREGSPDQTPDAATEVAAFFGNAVPSDFEIVGEDVHYTGDAEDWGYRRFILHYAHLCKVAGGLESFCIGSELRGITTIRGADHSFPAVAALIDLASDVRAVLGPSVKISYAADWSEYFGYHVDGNVYFHLDPLWNHHAVDFIGVDNYLPISDWRDGTAHLDADWGSIYDIGYLKANIAGGEGAEWYYASPEARDAQIRSPIEDGAHGEDWVFRPKDFRSWWASLHHERIDGIRNGLPTVWRPGSKPIRFTEYGCPAVDKGTNTPNRFYDPKSSESALPHHSTGAEDPYIQLQYFRAMAEFWRDPENNPVSALYDGAMVDFDHSYAWAWDARPFPEFPRNTLKWADGENHRLGHCLNGRATAQPLDAVVREIAERSGAEDVDTSRLHGLVRGYVAQDVASARSVLQPLSLVYGFDSIEAEGRLSFVSRLGLPVVEVDRDGAVIDEGGTTSLQAVKVPEAEVPNSVRLVHVTADGDYDIRVADAKSATGADQTTSQTEVSLSLSAAEAASAVSRWLAEARSSRDVLKLRLPPSAISVRVGSIISFEGLSFRVDRVEVDEARSIEAVRIERSHYKAPVTEVEDRTFVAKAAPVPVTPLWFDLPLITGDEAVGAPHVAMTARPWPGAVALWSSDEDAGYVVNRIFDLPATVGITETPLLPGRAGVLDRGPALRIRLLNGALSSVSRNSLLNGVNLAAIGSGDVDGWEIIQFSDAVLVAPDTYEVTTRLRGQFGTDKAPVEEWPVGSLFVLLNEAVAQVDLPPTLVGVERHYRSGVAALGFGDVDVVHRALAIRGLALRPLSVAHPRVKVLEDGSARLSWIRRTRVGGDSWEGFDVPLAEEREAYEVVITSLAGEVVRRQTVTEPAFLYTAAERNEDGTLTGFQAGIAQISSRFGPGQARTVTVG